MSMFGELNDLLNRIPVWKELLTLPKRVRAIEERLNLAGAIAVDDREVCPFCRQGRLDLISEEDDPILGVVGVKQRTFKCDNAGCAKETRRQREP